jgi:hypothetical protein
VTGGGLVGVELPPPPHALSINSIANAEVEHLFTVGKVAGVYQSALRVPTFGRALASNPRVHPRCDRRR